MLTKGTESDRSRILAYCMEEPNINIFIIGDIEIHGFNKEFQEIWLQIREDGLVGVVLRYHDNFIIYSKNMDMDFQEVSDLILSRDAKIVSGKHSVMEQLKPLLGENFFKREMFFCELKDGSRLLPPDARVQVATGKDAQEITQAYGMIAEFSGLYSGDGESLLRQISNRIESREGIHRIIRENGLIVSHGNTTAETSVSAMIGGLFTLPGHRNTGYGSRILSALCRDLLNNGKHACLFYDNPDSGRIFQRLGFNIIEKWTILGRV